jgi:hypothetical protein
MDAFSQANKQAIPYAGQPVAAPRETYFARDFFTYELDITALAAAASTTQTFTIQADSDFLWTKAAYFADIAVAIQTQSSLVVPLATVLIQDTGSGRNLMSSAVPISSIFGSGGLPMILPRQRLFVARSQVQVTVTNFAVAGTTYNIRLSFIGEKGFRA